MPFTEEQSKRMIALHALIEGNKSHEYAAPTYRDSASLFELAEIVLSVNDSDEDTLTDKAAILSYLAYNYRMLGRPVLSAKYYTELMKVFKLRNSVSPYSDEELTELSDEFFTCIKMRTFYVDDPCEDVIELMRGILSDETIEYVYKKASRSRHFKNDPVEMTDEYLAVIDEVERLVDENKRFDFCHEKWALKTKYLKKKGITWRSPAILNPGVRFD